MQTFDQALYELYIEKQISYENAIAHADSKNDLRLMIKMQSENYVDQLGASADDLSIEEDRSDSLRW
jgi:twitching motility protein PilU